MHPEIKNLKRKLQEQGFFKLIDPEIQIYIHRLFQIPWLATAYCCQGHKIPTGGHNPHANYHFLEADAYIMLYFDKSYDRMIKLLKPLAKEGFEKGKGWSECRFEWEEGCPGGMMEIPRVVMHCTAIDRDYIFSRLCDIMEKENKRMQDNELSLVE